MKSGAALALSAAAIARSTHSAAEEMKRKSVDAGREILLDNCSSGHHVPKSVGQAVTRALAIDPEIDCRTDSRGLSSLRKAAAAMHRRATGQQVDPDRHVLITAGCNHAIDLALRVLLAPGDEVIVQDPGYAPHVQKILANGARPVLWPSHRENGWKPDFLEFSSLVGPNTKAVVLTSPGNPTGAVLDRELLTRVAEVTRQNDVKLIMDNAYASFIHNGSDAFNPAMLPQMKDHVINAHTLSKSHAMSGWRIGFAVVPDAWIMPMQHAIEYSALSVPRVSQIAALAALAEDPEYLQQHRDSLRARQALALQRIQAMPNIFETEAPMGGFYLFPRLIAANGSVEDTVAKLQAETGVNVLPGTDFGPSGEGHVRISFAAPEDDIHAGFDRMQKFFAP